MTAMRINVPIIDTTMDPMQPSLLEKNPNMGKENAGRDCSRPAPVGHQPNFSA